MSKISEALKLEPRQYSMSQALMNASNLIGAARAKLISNKDSAAAELDAAAAACIKVARSLVPTFDFGVSPNFSVETPCETASSTELGELTAKLQELTDKLDERNAEIAKLRQELAVAARPAPSAEITELPPAEAAPKKAGKSKKPASIVDPAGPVDPA